MGDAPTEEKDYGLTLFGACYYKFFHKRRETQADLLKQVRSGQMPDMVLTDDEKAIAMRSMMSMGAGTLVGGVSVYLIRKIQHRVLRAPPSLVLTGALCAVGSIGGALGGISLSNYNEKKRLLEEPLIVPDRECPAYKHFAACASNQDCLDATAKDFMQQRLLSGYYQCKSRGVYSE